MKRISLLMALVVVGACASSDQTPGVQVTADKATGYSSEPGKEPVGVIPVATLHDARRNKNLDVSVQYPTRGGPFPLIIFSHDFGSSSQGYEQLISYWSSHGYVCIRPSHADAGTGRDAMHEIFAEPSAQERDRRRAERRGMSEAEARQQRASRDERERREMARMWETQHEAQWSERARDVSLVIDQLDDLETRFPELKGKIDRAKIGVAGHSLGALTAMLTAGVKTFGNPPLSLGDPRVKAVVALSPQGVSTRLGLTAQSFADVRVPALFMTGSEDHGLTADEEWQWRKTAYANAPDGDKYFVLLQGGRHSTFAGTFAPVEIPQTTSMPQPMQPQPYPPGDPRNPPQIYDSRPMQSGPINPQVARGLFNDVRLITLAFWDAYLKGSATGREFLDTTAAKLGGVTLEKK